LLSADLLWPALALMLVIEGLMPLVSPRGWRRAFERILSLQDGLLRFFGLCSVGLGLALLWLVS
jgi:uncharacterized protein